MMLSTRFGESETSVVGVGFERASSTLGDYHWIEEGPSQNGDHSPASYSRMRIELNYQAETLEEAICQTIVAYLRKGMAPRELLDQLIARGFVRDPGDNALEVVIQRLAEMAEQMRHDRTGAPRSPNPV